MILADRDKRAELYVSYSRASDLPLMLLALLMVPVLLLPEVFTMAPDQANLLEAGDWFIYAAFATDYLIKLYLAPSKWEHIRRNWLDLLLLALPLLRPLRLVRSIRLIRLLRAARVLVFVVEGFKKLNGLLSKRGLNVVLLGTIVIVVACAGLVTIVEHGSGGNIKEFSDALWWAAATVTTVGYGDVVPVTPEGRGIAVFLMLAGIAFYSVVTANVAAFFVEAGTEKTEDELSRKMDLILARLDAMEGAEIKRESNNANEATRPG